MVIILCSTLLTSYFRFVFVDLTMADRPFAAASPLRTATPGAMPRNAHRDFRCLQQHGPVMDLGQDGGITGDTVANTELFDFFERARLNDPTIPARLPGESRMAWSRRIPKVLRAEAFVAWANARLAMRGVQAPHCIEHWVAMNWIAPITEW